jgi:NADPH:quinone reductase
MHAISLSAFGPPDVLRYEQVADPEPGPDQVRIAVEASGVHVIDTTIRAGHDGGPLPLPELPMTPGREVAGVVEVVGEDVDRAWIGRRVVAHLGPASGGYAELAVAPASSLHHLDDRQDPAAAVAMIGTGRTTMSILDAAQVEAEDVALVTSAAGGIGTLLVQALRGNGATVVGAAGGPAKVERVERLGAIAVDYTRPGWGGEVAAALDGREVSVAFDAVGGAIGRTALELLGPGGTLVLYGWFSGEPTRLDASDVFARSLTVTAAIGPGLFKRPGGLRPLEERALAAVASG